MCSLPASTSLILVAIVPTKRDMEIIRLLGWYRIPLRFAPKVIDVDYLAFYQPGQFGEGHRWCIETYAAMRGHELTTRAELFRDEPDHPRVSEEYYKIQLGELCRLERPILAGRWRRLTFLYTTGELFSRAQSIDDLVVRSEEREVLWRSLRERALHSSYYKPGFETRYVLDREILAFLGDIFA